MNSDRTVWGWKVFEAPGVEPVFPEKRQAINYAQNRASFRSGEMAESMPIEKDEVLGINFLVGLAQIEAHTGQSQEAVKLLRRLLTIPAGEYVSVARLKIDPVWDPIRSDPGFQKLLSEPEPETIYK